MEFGEIYTVKTVKNAYAAKAILIATGKPPLRPEIPGVKEFEGKGVSYCTTCDGFFYKNKRVGILGNGNYAVEQATELEVFTKDITIYTNALNTNFSGEYEKAIEKYKINKEHVIKVEGNTVLSNIILESGSLQLYDFINDLETA